MSSGPHGQRVRRPALVVSDLDGTFLAPDGSVSPASREVLARATDAGLHVVFATGRPPRWLEVLADLPLVDPVVVASNGALLWDLRGWDAVERHDLPAEVVLEVAHELRAAIPDAAFGVEHGARFGFEPAYDSGLTPADVRNDARFDCAPIDELVAEPAVKLLVQCPSLTAEQLAALAAPIIGTRLTATHSAFGSFGLLEVSAPGVTKASTLDAYAARLGVDPAHVAAFGDMPNDLEMLRWAGRPHVMERSHPDLAVLDAVRIGSNAESAVAATIAAWLG